MKKALSLLCVLAMLLVMVVPAFAATEGQPEGATAGQVAENLANEVAANPSNSAAAAALTEQVTANKAVVVSSTMSTAMRNAINAHADVTTTPATPTGAKSLVSFTFVADKGQTLGTPKVTVTDTGAVLQVDFANNVQSPLGTYVVLNLNQKLDASKNYMWVCDDGQTGVAFVMGTSNSEYPTQIQFWAPHFSTYAIVPVGATSNTGSSVLAATGADMSVTFVMVAVLAAALMIGSAVVLKRRSVEK